MSIQRNLQKCMEDWKQISGLDFCLLSEDNSVFVATGERRIPSAGKLENFRNGDALCTANASCCLYKVMDRDELLYILIVWGSGESTSTIGELAVCQIRSLIEAYSEKNDKNAFMQKLLLGSYSEVETFNRAKKLHISSSCQRAV